MIWRPWWRPERAHGGHQGVTSIACSIQCSTQSNISRTAQQDRRADCACAVPPKPPLLAAMLVDLGLRNSLSHTEHTCTQGCFFKHHYSYGAMWPLMSVGVEVVCCASHECTLGFLLSAAHDDADNNNGTPPPLAHNDATTTPGLNKAKQASSLLCC